MNQTLTDSQMAMWQAVIALIHSDGKIHPDEIQFLKERFAKLKTSEEQKKILMRTINAPDSLKESFLKITKPQDRAQFIYFARLLFWSDGDFAEQEKRVLESLQNDVLNKVDLAKVIHSVDKVVQDFTDWDQKRRDDQPIHRKIINAIIFWEDLDALD